MGCLPRLNASLLLNSDARIPTLEGCPFDLFYKYRLEGFSSASFFYLMVNLFLSANDDFAATAFSTYSAADNPVSQEYIFPFDARHPYI